jgi:ubiquinone/menaquinone biosynthesis C-methylase UbiE
LECDINHDEVRAIGRLVRCHEKTVLEIGCGNGRLSRHLAPGTREYIALDPNPDSIDQARQAALGATFQVGSGESLGFKNERFDVVLFTLSLHHQNAALALAEAFRVLKTSGEAIVLEPTPNSEVQRLFHIYDDETIRLVGTQEAMARSQFREMGREVFLSEWKFDSLDELIAYDFGQGSQKPNVVRMKKILGKKMDQPPVHLLDELVVVLLRKQSRAT